MYMSKVDAVRSSGKPVLHTLLKPAIPIMTIQCLQTGYQLTDTYWVGRLGARAVAAVSVNFPINFVVLALGSGFEPGRIKGW